MSDSHNPLKIGLLVNPLAGIGGSLALKGSDGETIQQQALKAGAIPQAGDRAVRALQILKAACPEVRLHTWAGDMGETSARQAGFTPVVEGRAGGEKTSAEDTREAASTLAEKVDLLLFAGGDGTARDICDAVGDHLPVLGIPAGCKMHSGVYAINPESAGELLARLVQGGVTALVERDVRDIDEEAFRRGELKARWYGSLQVPAEDTWMQQVKSGSGESEALDIQEIATWVAETLMPDTLYLMGAGSTVAAVMEQLGLDNTLLGVDVVHDGELLLADTDERGLLKALSDHPGPAKAVISVIGGQGHLLGRGNQQFSPQVIRKLGRENLIILATRGKLRSLEGRPLQLDTGDAGLDQSLAGLIAVITGYEQQLLYPLGPVSAGESTDISDS